MRRLNRRASAAPAVSPTVGRGKSRPTTAPIPGRAKRPDTMICVYFLLLSRPGAKIASEENSFSSEPLSRGDRCLPRVVELETASSAGNLSAHRGAATVWFFYWLCLRPMVDPPAEEDGFELAVPPRRERLWAATPGKHCRFGPQPVSGSAFHAAVLASSEEPFAGAGPMVRIRFPPAASPLRTDFSRGRSRTASRI